MIELEKLPKPPFLIRNGDLFTAELMMDFYSNGIIDKIKQNRYNNLEVKATLKIETNEKCAYCESKLTHIYPGDIEHIVPKSIYPRLTFAWSNLTLCCFTCNNKKRNFLDKNCKLLNPYKDKINSHLRAFGPMIFHIKSSLRGELTLRKLDLNRKELVERRKEKLEELQLLIDKHCKMLNQNLKDLIEDEINDFISNSEFSFSLKQFYIDHRNAA